MHDNGEEGQAILIVVLAMGIFLLGATGLAIDGSHLYSQRQMAQSAADSAAIAGIMSIFDGTNTTGTHAFSTGGPFNCTTTDARTPCMYAAKNAFGATGRGHRHDRLPDHRSRCESCGVVSYKSCPSDRVTQCGHHSDAYDHPDVFHHGDRYGYRLRSWMYSRRFRLSCCTQR